MTQAVSKSEGRPRQHGGAAYDVAIVGAGPAGATLARLIGDRYRVLLVDRRPLDLPSVLGEAGKCCGGLLAPDAQQVMGQMGLGLPQSVLVSPQLFVVRAMDLPSGLERYYQRFYLNMDREKFDRWLVSLVPRCVDSRYRTQILEYRRADGDSGFELTMRTGRVTYTERARVLVGADGAHSGVRRWAFGRHATKTYVALQEWFRVEQSLPHYTAIFDPAITDFYVWTIPKEDYLLVGAAVPRQGARERFGLLKARLMASGLALGQPTRREGCLLLRPGRPGQLALGQDGVALVGEAAGWISPSSAEGISYAMRSALALADAMGPGLEGCVARYRSATRGLAANLLGKRLKSVVMYSGPLRRMVMRSGVMSAGPITLSG